MESITWISKRGTKTQGPSGRKSSVDASRMGKNIRALLDDNLVGSRRVTRAGVAHRGVSGRKWTRSSVCLCPTHFVLRSSLVVNLPREISEDHLPRLPSSFLFRACLSHP